MQIPREPEDQMQQLRRQQLRQLAAAVGFGNPPDGATAIVDQALFDCAREEQLAPLIGARVSSGATHCATAQLEREAVHEHHRCVAKALYTEGALERLCAPLIQAGIPVLGLKGLALVRTVFSPGERSMSDIDLLVPASRWREAFSLVQRAGAVFHDPYERPFTALHDYAVPVLTKEGVMVELHRYLCERPLFSPDLDGPGGVFARASRSADGILVPEPGDLFLGLAVHAAHHGFHLPFRAVVDGLTLGKSPDLVPAVVVARAARWNAQRALTAWIMTLGRFGLGVARWGPSFEHGRHAEAVRAVANEAPWPETDLKAGERRRILRTTRLLDTASRRVAYLGQRVGLKCLDAVAQKFPSLLRTP